MKFVDDILSKVDNINNEETGNDGLNKTRATVACAIIGGVVGIMIGVSSKWNVFYSGIGGAVGGALLGNIFTSK